jgi:hypothetical protein
MCFNEEYMLRDVSLNEVFDSRTAVAQTSSNSLIHEVAIQCTCAIRSNMRGTREVISEGDILWQENLSEPSLP